jgi:hypothetical protein
MQHDCRKVRPHIFSTQQQIHLILRSLDNAVDTFAKCMHEKFNADMISHFTMHMCDFFPAKRLNSMQDALDLKIVCSMRCPDFQQPREVAGVKMRRHIRQICS